MTEPHSKDSTREARQPWGPGARAWCRKPTLSLGPRIYCSEALRRHVPLWASFSPRASHGTSPAWTRKPRRAAGTLPEAGGVASRSEGSPHRSALGSVPGTAESPRFLQTPRRQGRRGRVEVHVLLCVCARVHARVSACVCAGDALPHLPLNPT